MGKGGSSAPTEQTVTQTTLPEYAQPYVERLFQRAETESKRGYEPFGGQRIAGFSDPSYTGMEGIQNLGPGIAGLDQAMYGTQRAGAMGSQYANMDPGAFSQFGFGPTDRYGGFQASGVVGSDIANAGSAFGPYGPNMYQYDPTSRYGQQAAANLVGEDMVNVEGAFADGGAEGYNYGNARQFTPQAASRYMSPYMQNVVDVEKENAQLDFERAQAGRDATATQQGAYGGSRQAVVNALAQEDLARTKGEIQSRGQQAAYEDAIRAFGADREATMRRENERAAEFARTQGLSVDDYYRAIGESRAGMGLGFDVLGQQAAEQFAREQAQAGEAGRTQQLSADDYYRMLDTRLSGRGMGFDVLGQQAGEQFAREQAQAGEQGRVQSSYDASRQAAAQLGLEGLGLDLNAQAQLADMGGVQRQAAMDYYDRLMGVGDTQRQMEQMYMDQQYQDFLAQQSYPAEQLQQYSNLLRGNTVGSTVRQAQIQQSNPWKDILGGGISALSLSQVLGGGD